MLVVSSWMLRVWMKTTFLIFFQNAYYGYYLLLQSGKKINRTNKYFKQKHLIHKVDMWSFREKNSYSFHYLCVFALITSVLPTSLQIGLECVLTANI